MYIREEDIFRAIYHQLVYESDMRYYEKFVDGKIDRTKLRTALDYANELK